MNRIVLAHSGGADTLAMIPWLAERHRAEVVTVTLDLGQGRQLDGVHERALAAGAARAHIIDAREEFARDFILPALRANALSGGRMPLIRSLGRSAIARRLKEIADIERASAVAHGDRHAGRQPAFETLLRSLGCAIDVIAPMRTPDSSYATDTNLWGRAIEYVDAGEPEGEAWAAVYVLTKSADGAPEAPAYVDIAFDRDVPIAINGVEMPLVELIQSLATIAGDHGVGRLDEGSRVRCEAPAAIVLHLAHAELRRVVLPPSLERRLSDLAGKYADLADDGLWFTPARAAMDELFENAQPPVSGIIRLKLHKAACEVVARTPDTESVAQGAQGR